MKYRANHAMSRTPRKKPIYRCYYSKVDTNVECYGLAIDEHELETLMYEIISKQAEVVLNVDSLHDISKLDLQIKQQSEHKRQLDALYNEKRILYERFILQEINSVEYKVAKSNVDAELKRLEHLYKSLSDQVTLMTNKRDADAKTAELADSVSKQKGLSKPILDSLVEKVFIFPGNYVKIAWKTAGFINT
jgi:predicted nuclease with TOPRIM domain